MVAGFLSYLRFDFHFQEPILNFYFTLYHAEMFLLWHPTVVLR